MAETKISKAIIPVAGLGTRMLPATKAIPKELLPILNKPIIQYVVEEAISAGIKEIIFITRSGKQAIENHFDYNYELEHRLKSKKEKRMLNSLKGDMSKVSHPEIDVARYLKQAAAISKKLHAIKSLDLVSEIFSGNISTS